MSFSRLHKLVTYALATLGLGALGLGGELTPPVLVLVALATIASWWAEGPRIEEGRWQRGWNVALLGLLVVEILRGVVGEPPLALALEMSAALQISRLANRRRAAEHQQIAILAFLHLCAATVLTTEVIYGALFLGFVVLTPWMLALTHLRAEIEGHFAPPGTPGPEQEATLARVLASRRLVGGAFLVGTAAISVPLFFSTALLFVLFPRVGLGFLAFGESAGTHLAGFGSDVELGDVGVLRDDPTVVMRIVPPPGTVGTEVESFAVYLRGTSFDAYDGRRWTRTHTGGERIRRYGEDFLLTRYAEPGRDHPWQISLEHIDQEVVFLPPHTVAVEVPPRYASGLDVGRDLTIYPGLELRYEDADSLGLRYTAWTSGDPSEEPIDTLGEDDLRRYLALPPGHESLRAIAEAWTAGATTPRARAEAILARLHGPAFTYTTRMEDVGDRPPLVWFLEVGRRGHCEYFASAMAILLREVGVPTRNVTGFASAHFNSYGRYYAVRSGDAHAWVEAYLPGEGWVRFDPTPASDEPASALARMVAEARALADAIRSRWDEWIVGYDLRAQRDFARAVGRLFSGEGGASERTHVEEQDDGRSQAPWRAIGIVVALVALFALADRAYRALLAPPEKKAPTPDAAVREIIALYRELERELARLGTPRPPSATPLEHARALSAQGARSAAIAAKVTARYLDVRFGGVVIDATELAALRAEVRSLRALPAENARAA